jgi:hypothetical protein
MPFHFGLFAEILLQVSRSSLHERVKGLTQQEQINKCREMEANARVLAHSGDSERQEGHQRLADDWAKLAADIEREYYVLVR